MHEKRLYFFSFRVSWVRHRDIHHLTVEPYTYTSDQRCRVVPEWHTRTTGCSRFPTWRSVEAITKTCANEHLSPWGRQSCRPAGVLSCPCHVRKVSFELYKVCLHANKNYYGLRQENIDYFQELRFWNTFTISVWEYVNNIVQLSHASIEIFRMRSDLPNEQLVSCTKITNITYVRCMNV